MSQADSHATGTTPDPTPLEIETGASGAVDLPLLECTPSQRPLVEEVLEGLTAEEKFLPAKLHYDHRGSELFERICSVDEYYITRTELGIMKASSEEIADSIGSGAMLIEPGSGASLKTRLLLDALDSPAAYVPVDISRDFLLEAAGEIARRHEVEVLPVWADFTKAHPLPEADGEVEGRAIYFPGSTIGNFTRPEARDLLGRFAEMVGANASGERGGSVIVGFDQKKAVERMEAAYNDAEGVTAEFNFNVLDRLGRELDADLDRGKFTFRAEWDEEVGAIVSRLRAREAHEVEVAGTTIAFDAGEPIRMEESHKYTREEFEALAGKVGLSLDRVWSDAAEDFAVARLV